MKIIQKGSNIQLTKNFNSNEIDCKCSHKDCTYTIIDDELLSIIQTIRNQMNTPFIITSAFRCRSHNKAVGGKPLSMHLIFALDIFCNDLDKLAELAKENGLSTGIHSQFIHTDNRSDQTSWFY